MTLTVKEQQAVLHYDYDKGKLSPEEVLAHERDVVGILKGETKALQDVVQWCGFESMWDYHGAFEAEGAAVLGRAQLARGVSREPEAALALPLGDARTVTECAICEVRDPPDAPADARVRWAVCKECLERDDDGDEDYDEDDDDDDEDYDEDDDEDYEDDSPPRRRGGL